MMKILESKLDKRNKMCLDSKIIESLFVDDEFFSHVSAYKRINSGRYPKTDQWCSDGFFNLSFALAGFGREDVSVELEGNTLWIFTNKIYEESKRESPGFIHRGIAKRSFRKGYFLDSSLDCKKVTATMKNGLLKVTIPVLSDMSERINIEVINE